MKFNKKSSDYGKSAIDILVMLGGVAVGNFVSGAAHEAIKSATDTKTVGLAKRAGIAAVGIGGASAIASKDELSTFLKSVGVGMAGRQVFDGGKEALATTPTATKLVAGNKLQKSLAAGFGLACPCDQIEMQPLARPVRRGMKSPTLAALGMPNSEPSSLDSAVQVGQLIAA